VVTGPVALGIAVGVVVAQRVGELKLARRNEGWARAPGAREFGAGHYPLFFVLHGGWLIAWPIEASLRDGGAGLAPPPIAGLAIATFVLAQGLRYWSIASLGRRWNTRILVLADMRPIRSGPYRFIAHPNYLAVSLEIAALPLAFGANLTAAVASFANAVVLLGVRIPAETRALKPTHAPEEATLPTSGPPRR